MIATSVSGTFSMPKVIDPIPTYSIVESTTGIKTTY
jgi:hypothetical protein